MKRKTRKRAEATGTADQILGAVDKIIPGFHGFFKKLGESRVFGARIGGIQKEIGRRFSGAKK